MRISAKEIIECILRSKNITAKSLSEKMGLDRPQAIYDIQKLKTKNITSKMADKIISVYPDINRSWLLTGEGDMLNENNRNGVVSINQSQIHDYPSGTPVLDIDVTCGREFRDLSDERIIGYVDLPIIRKDSHIVTATGDSMTPKVLSGDLIVIREIKNRDYFLWGNMYLVVTPEYRMLKYVEKHPTEPNEYIILRSENKAHSDIELPIKDIFRLFVVENIISINNL